MFSTALRASKGWKSADEISDQLNPTVVSWVSVWCQLIRSSTMCSVLRWPAKRLTQKRRQSTGISFQRPRIGRGRGSNYPEELESVFSDVSRHDWLKESELGTDGRCGKRWSRRSTGSSVVNTPATLSMEYGRWMSVARQSMTASYRPGYGSLSNDCNYSTEHLSVAGELSNEFKILQHAVY